jgi:MOSC domain-containing protein YiiM
MGAVSEARAVPGRGLEGDRYFEGRGSLSRWASPGRELTLIAQEDLDAMAAEGVELTPQESRRNVLVSGVPLHDLLKEQFLIGEVAVLGARLCQPCKYLIRKTGKEVLPAMVGRGGLRVQILNEGIIRVGDAVTPGTGSVQILH